ncbi:MAG TPA: ROK family glucokinase [Actinomyces sp.]|jgi:glucokinase|nr:ROK family glucokinase [Acidobacteriota bacterium]HHT41082.1 ROK family glucokinase [Actinomyces sp.]
MTLTIGVDVGGTKIAAGLVTEEGEVLRTARRDTPASEVDATADAIADLVTELRADEDVAAVGIGAAGFCDAERTSVVYAPNLAWRNEPLAEKITKATGLPTVVENDANAAAWGEFRFGAAKKAKSAIVVTLGTGIGGGIIINDHLVRGFQGFAGEIGHMQMKAGGRRCGCGLRGCWERYGSGTALVHEAREIATVAPASAVRLLEMAGGDPQQITGQMVTAAAKEGDPVALDVLETVADWIGRGLADLTAILDPEMIVLGGGVATAGEILLEPVQKAFEKNLTARLYRDIAEITLAQLGVPAGLIGAADLARLPA